MNSALILLLAFAGATALPAYDGLPPYPRKLPTPAELFLQAKTRNATKEDAFKNNTESTTLQTPVLLGGFKEEAVTLQDANIEGATNGATEENLTVAPVLTNLNNDEEGSGSGVTNEAEGSGQTPNTASAEGQHSNEQEITTVTLEQASQTPLQLNRASNEEGNVNSSTDKEGKSINPNDTSNIIGQIQDSLTAQQIPPLSLDSDTLFVSSQQKTVKKRFVLPGGAHELTISGLLQNAIDIMYTFGWDTSGLQLLHQIYNSGFIQKHIELKRQFFQFILNILQFVIDKTGDYTTPSTNGYYPPPSSAEDPYPPPVYDVRISSQDSPSQVVQWNDDYLANYQRRKRFVNLLDLSSILDGSFSLLSSFGVDTSGLTLLHQLYDSGFAGGVVGFKKNLLNLMATSLSYALDFLPRRDEDDDDDDLYDVQYPYPGRLKRFLSFETSNIDIPKMFNGARDVVVGLGLDPSGVDFLWTMYNSSFVQKHLQFKKQVIETLVSTLQFIIRYFPQQGASVASITPEVSHSVDYGNFNSHGQAVIQPQTIQIALEPVQVEGQAEQVLPDQNVQYVPVETTDYLYEPPIEEPAQEPTPEVIQTPYEPTYTVHTEETIPKLQIQPGTRFVPVNINKVVPLEPHVGSFQEDLHFSDESGHKIPHLVQVYPEESVPVYLVPEPEEPNSQPYPPPVVDQLNMPAIVLELPLPGDDKDLKPYPALVDADQKPYPPKGYEPDVSLLPPKPDEDETDYPPYPGRQLRKRLALFPSTLSFTKAFDQSISLLNFVGVDTSTLVFLKRLYQSGFAQKFASFKTKVYELMVSTMNLMLGYYPSGILEQMFSLTVGNPQDAQVESNNTVTQGTSIGAGGLSALFEKSGAFGSVLSTMINVFTNLNIDATTLLYLEALYNSPLASRLVFFQGRVYDMMMEVVDNMNKEVPEEVPTPNVEEQPDGGGHKGAQVGLDETDGGDGLQDTSISELDNVGAVNPVQSESDGAVKPQTTTTTTTTETPKPYAPARPYPGKKKYIPPLLPYPASFDTRFKESDRRKRFAVQSKFSVDGLYTQVINLLDSLGIETSGLRILQRIHNSFFSYKNLLFQRKIVNLISRVCQFVLRLLPEAPLEVNQQLFSLDALLGKFAPTTTRPYPPPQLHPTPATPLYPAPLPINPYPTAPALVVTQNPSKAYQEQVNHHILQNYLGPQQLDSFGSPQLHPTPATPLYSALLPINPYPTAPASVVTQNPIKAYQEQVNHHILQNYLGPQQLDPFGSPYQSQQLPVGEEDLSPFESNVVEVKLNDTVTESNHNRSKRNVAQLQKQEKVELIAEDYVPRTGDKFLYDEDGLQVGVVLGKGFETDKVHVGSKRNKRSIIGSGQQDFEDTPEASAAGGGAEILTEISIVHRVHEVTSTPKKQSKDYNNQIVKEWKGKHYKDIAVPFVAADIQETVQSKRSANEEEVQIVYPVSNDGADEMAEVVYAESTSDPRPQDVNISTGTLEENSTTDATLQPMEDSQTETTLPQEHPETMSDVSTVQPEETSTEDQAEVTESNDEAPTVDVVFDVKNMTQSKAQSDLTHTNLVGDNKGLDRSNETKDTEQAQPTNSGNIMSVILGATPSVLSDNQADEPSIEKSRIARDTMLQTTAYESLVQNVLDNIMKNKQALNRSVVQVVVHKTPVTPRDKRQLGTHIFAGAINRFRQLSPGFEGFSSIPDHRPPPPPTYNHPNRFNIPLPSYGEDFGYYGRRHFPDIRQQWEPCKDHPHHGPPRHYPALLEDSDHPHHGPPRHYPALLEDSDHPHHGPPRHYPALIEDSEEEDDEGPYPPAPEEPNPDSEEDDDEGPYPPADKVKPVKDASDASYPYPAPAEVENPQSTKNEKPSVEEQVDVEKVAPAVGFRDLPKFYVIKDFTMPIWYHGYKLGGASTTDPITYLHHFNNGHSVTPDTQHQVVQFNTNEQNSQVDFNIGFASDSNAFANAAVDQEQTLSSWYDDFKVPENSGAGNFVHDSSFAQDAFADSFTSVQNNGNSFNTFDSGNSPTTNAFAQTNANSFTSVQNNDNSFNGFDSGNAPDANINAQGNANIFTPVQSNGNLFTSFQSGNVLAANVDAQANANSFALVQNNGNSFNSFDSGNVPATNFNPQANANFFGASFGGGVGSSFEGVPQQFSFAPQTTFDFAQPQWFASAPEQYDIPKLSPIEDFKLGDNAQVHSSEDKAEATKWSEFASSQISDVNEALGSDDKYNSDLAAAIAQANPQIFDDTPSNFLSEVPKVQEEVPEENEDYDEDEDDVIHAVISDVKVNDVDKDRIAPVRNYTEAKRKNTGDFFKAKQPVFVEAQREGFLQLSKGDGALPLTTKGQAVDLKGHSASSKVAHIAPNQNVVYLPQNASPADVNHFVYPGETSPYPYLQLVQDVVAYNRPTTVHHDAAASENVAVVTSLADLDGKKNKHYKFFLMPHYDRDVEFRSQDSVEKNFVVNSFTNALGDRLQNIQGPTFSFAPSLTTTGASVQNFGNNDQFVPTLFGRFGTQDTESGAQNNIFFSGPSLAFNSEQENLVTKNDDINFKSSATLQNNRPNNELSHVGSKTIASTTLVTHQPRKERLHQYNSFKVLPHFGDGSFDNQGLVRQNVIGGQGNQNSINVNIINREVVKVTDKETQTDFEPTSQATPLPPKNWIIKSRSQTTTPKPLIITTAPTPKSTTTFRPQNHYISIDSAHRGDVFDYSDGEEPPSSPKYKWVLVTKEPPIVEPQDESLFENFLNSRPVREEKSIRQISSEMVDDLVGMVSSFHQATSEPPQMGKRLDSDVKKREVPESEEMSIVGKDVV